MPVETRIDYKIACIVYNCLNNPSYPSYLKSLLNIYEPPRTLRSSGRLTLETRLISTKFIERSFFVSAPRVWNGISFHTRASENFCTFKKRLKTEYFDRVYG